MDRRHPAAMRMVDDLDPAGRLDRAGGVDHLVDLRPGEPAEQGQRTGRRCRRSACRSAPARGRPAAARASSASRSASAPAGAPSPQPAAWRLAVPAARRSAASTSAGGADAGDAAVLEQQHAVAGLEHGRAVGHHERRSGRCRRGGCWPADAPRRLGRGRWSPRRGPACAGCGRWRGRPPGAGAGPARGRCRARPARSRSPAAGGG